MLRYATAARQCCVEFGEWAALVKLSERHAIRSIQHISICYLRTPALLNWLPRDTGKRHLKAGLKHRISAFFVRATEFPRSLHRTWVSMQTSQSTLTTDLCE